VGYLNFRSQTVGGSVIDPLILDGNGDAPVPRLRLIRPERIQSLLGAKHVVFAAHGFNLSYEEGARSLGRLEAKLDLSASELFVGILWPGDCWIPVINYPFEGDVTMECGRRLARFCNQHLNSTVSISFISHSLGGRVVLECIKNMDRKARAACLAAGAIKRDCLSSEYVQAFANAEVISILASHEDMVLRLAFPVGDAIGNILHDDYARSLSALGYNGPPRATGRTVPPWQIPDEADYGHHDYFPPSEPVLSDALQVNPKWLLPAGFMSRAIRGKPQTWP
jgi:hypothetical protein